MSDFLGNVVVPGVSPSGTFPLTVNYGVTTVIDPPTVTHTFVGSGNVRREQRFLLGNGARQWKISQEVDETERVALRNFWESRTSAYQPFTFNAPLADGTTEAVTVQFANEPLSWDIMGGEMARIDVNLIEVNTGSGPTHSVTATVQRYPDSTMATAMTGQVQKFIKLVRITPRASGYPTIYVANQRCTVGGQLYLARLLRWDGISQTACGMPGVSNESDQVQLVFGNADRAMRDLANDVQLDYARVECLLYHINSGYLMELWAGQIIPGGWQSNVGPEFTIQCSDFLWSPFLIAPPRNIGRRCPVLFNDGSECPFTSVGALNPNYPSADPASCDRGYVTPNGCDAHGMTHYYQGVVANPQAILTKDNSSGTWGLFRNSITAASVINDSAYGQPLPIVVTDIQMPVATQIISIRDEGDFLRALGVVGEGPMRIIVGSTLDGSLNHGPDTLGFRAIDGSHPAKDSDAEGNGPLEMFPFDDPQYFSAGTAALELLISNEPGIQPSAATQHTMQALVENGWKGYQWSTPTSRDAALYLMTNPVWLAANLYLLCRKYYNSSATVQESLLNLTPIISSAAICDLVVDRLVLAEEGQETQWKFIGVIRDRKPLRDWLADILLNCLGMFWFDFGKLSIGIRENGASQVAYTNGNIIYGSMRLSSLGPQFFQLSAAFADREHGWQTNIAEFSDDDYAKELGQGVIAQAQPAEMTLCGTADISPATRFAVTRGREEVGGITAAERKNARNVEWRTTILGLDTGPGTVASITHDEMPGGFGKVRVAKWTLNDDFSITLQGRSCTNSMYDLVEGPKPADTRPGDIPGNPNASADAKRPCWMPNTLAPPVGDPVMDVDDLQFSMQQVGTPQTAILVVGGETPVAKPLYKNPPRIADTAVVPGGNLLPGVYYVALGVQKGTQPSVMSTIKKVTIAESDGPSGVRLSGLSWPAGEWDKAILFAAATYPQRLCAQVEYAGPTVALPSEIVFNGRSYAPPQYPLKYATYGPANLNYSYLRTKIKQLAHPGAVPSFVSSVVDDTFTCMHMAADRTLDTRRVEGGVIWNSDADMLAVDDWTDRIVSVVTNKKTGVSPIVNMTVTAYDATTGTFTCSPSPTDLGAVPGDVFIVRFKPQWNADGTEFTDTGMLNGIFPQGTDNVTGERYGRVIAGPGKGQLRRVIEHTNTTYKFEVGFVGVTEDSIVTIEFVPWLQIVSGSVIDVSDYLVPTTLNADASILLQRGLLVQGVIVDKDGNESMDDISTVREFFPFNDISYGVGGQLQLGIEVEFGRGDGGPAEIAVGDVCSIREVISGGFLQGWSVVNQGTPVGDSTIDILKYDADTDEYASILGDNLIVIPDGVHDKVIFSAAFDLGLESLEVKVGDLFKVIVLSVGSTAPLSPVVRIYWGNQLAKSSDIAILGPPVNFP